MAIHQPISAFDDIPSAEETALQMLGDEFVAVIPRLQTQLLHAAVDVEKKRADPTSNNVKAMRTNIRAVFIKMQTHMLNGGDDLGRYMMKAPVWHKLGRRNPPKMEAAQQTLHDITEKLASEPAAVRPDDQAIIDFMIGMNQHLGAVPLEFKK